jgi:hypothetical protein
VARVGGVERLAGFVVEHFADDDGGREGCGVGEREAEFGVAFALGEQVGRAAKQVDVAGDPELAGEVGVVGSAGCARERLNRA